jgi:hypothetical protein
MLIDHVKVMQNRIPRKFSGLGCGMTMEIPIFVR